MDFTQPGLLVHDDSLLHSAIIESLFASFADFFDPLNGLERRCHELTVILDRDVPSPLELKGGIDGHLLSGCFSKRLGPPHLTRVPLLLEGLVAL